MIKMQHSLSFIYFYIYILYHRNFFQEPNQKLSLLSIHCRNSIIVLQRHQKIQSIANILLFDITGAGETRQHLLAEYAMPFLDPVKYMSWVV